MKRRRAGLGPNVTIHILRHTAITWAMQGGGVPAEVAQYFSISLEELQRTYWRHHPDHQGSVGRALSRRKT